MSEEGGRCPYPGAKAPDAKEAGCPFPGAEVPEKVGWDQEAHVRAMRKARAAAESSHVSQETAQLMAHRVAEQRAERRGVEQIDDAFLAQLSKKLGYGHPLSDRAALPEFEWTEEAEARLAEVPQFCRELTRWRVEYTAIKKGLGRVITPAVMEVKYEMWSEVSHAIQERHTEGLPWTEAAKQRFDRVPEFVRGQVLEAVEGNAKVLGATQVDEAVVDQVIERWSNSGDFHEGVYGFR